MTKLIQVLEYKWKEKIFGKSVFEKRDFLLINPDKLVCIEQVWDGMFRVVLQEIWFYTSKEEVELIKTKQGVVFKESKMIKVYVLMGTNGQPFTGFYNKKDAKLYAINNGLEEWHLGETDGLFDGLSEINIH